MISWPDKVIIYTDGASRGNPGPSSIGVYVLDTDNQLVAEESEFIGEQTNNYAEYMAVIRALEMAIASGSKDVHLKVDSQLLVRQMSGQYKVKAKGIKPLFMKVKELAEHFNQIKYEHIKREFNKQADRLANEALDKRTD